MLGERFGVELEMIRLSGTVEEQSNRELTLLLANDGYDVLFMNSDRYDQYARIDRLEPLNDYFEAGDLDPAPYRAALDMLTREDGNFYGLPLDKSVWITYLNTEIFENAGIPLPDSDWTWDDFERIATELTEGEGADRIYGAVSPPWWQSWAAHATQSGVDYFTADGDPNIDHPAFLNALERRVEWQDDGIIVPLSDMRTTKAHYGKGYFASGQIGMLPVGQWVIAQLNGLFEEDGFPFEYEIQVLPHPDGTPPTTWGNLTSYAITNFSEYQNEAYELIEYLVSEEFSAINVERGRSPIVMSDEARAAYEEIFPDFVQNTHVLTDTDYLFVDEKPMSSIYINVMIEESDLVLSGEKDPAEALADARARIESEIAAESE